MKILFLTNEYPPYVYGGAGTHIDYLSREMSKICPVDVRCFGDQNSQSGDLRVRGFKNGHIENYASPQVLHRAFDAVQRSLDFNSVGIDADVVHVHTWYTHLAGIVAKLNYGIPLVLTVHSLEPLRPWKREQLGGGYDFSTWVEKTAIEMADAVVAVSTETKHDILRLFHVDEEKVHVVYNGIDQDEYCPTQNPEALKKYGVNPDKPFVLFIGRITRQKGIIHLVQAIQKMKGDYQVVLCAGSPDTKEIGEEMEYAVSEIQKEREGVIWIKEMLDIPTKVAFYSHAAVFCCPSVYEPFGIINLEAMACETPVVATDVGGIKEVVVHGETGYLVPVAMKDGTTCEPATPDTFSRDLARRIDELMIDEAMRIKMGKSGRQRVIDHFTWTKIAKETAELYKSLL